MMVEREIEKKKKVYKKQPPESCICCLLFMYVVSINYCICSVGYKN